MHPGEKFSQITLEELSLQIRGSVVVFKDEIHMERGHTIYYRNQD